MVKSWQTTLGYTEMDAAMRKQFAFVPTDHTGKPKIADRALIRSHAMQGKNKREGSRRSIREAKKAIQQSVHPRLGPPPPTDLALMKLPEDVDNHSQQLLTKCECSSRLNKRPL